jgi:hypothetical protein
LLIFVTGCSSSPEDVAIKPKISEDIGVDIVASTDEQVEISIANNIRKPSVSEV